MRKSLIAVTIIVFAAVFGLISPVAEAAGLNLSAGVVYQEGNILGCAAAYSGGALQYWFAQDQAIQLGMAIRTEGDQNVRLHGEYQKHFRREADSPHSFFMGGGLFYEDIPVGDDDWIVLYAPLGLRFQLPNSPVSFTANTSVRLIIDPESSLEIFNEVRIGFFYSF